MLAADELRRTRRFRDLVRGFGPTSGTLLTALAALGLLLLSSPGLDAASKTGMEEAVRGSDATQELWLPWTGCWSPGGSETGPVGAEEALGEGPQGLICVRALEDRPGVRITTVEGGQVVHERLLRTDGERVAVDESGCHGWERARWSGDARRLFIRSELECAGGVKRETTGIFALSPEGEWVDVQAVRVGERADVAVGVRRLVRVSPERVRRAGLPPFPDEARLAARTARVNATAPLRLEDVAEASREVHPEAVQALLLESETRFRLTADRLRALHRDGVPEDVIDMVVAVSFPDRFQVAGTGSAPDVRDRGAPARARTGYRSPRYGPAYSPFRSYRFGAFYGPYRYDPFFHSSFYYGGAFRGGFYGYGYRPVRLVPVRVGPERRGGAVVRGQGYLRGGSGSSGGDRSSGGGVSSSPSGTSQPAASSGGGSRVSPQGHRGSGDDDRRRARPRGGGSGSDDGGSGGTGGSGGL